MTLTTIVEAIVVVIKHLKARAVQLGFAWLPNCAGRGWAKGA